MKKVLIVLVIFLAINVLLMCGFYFFQEKLIFYPKVLDKEYVYKFDNRFEEVNIETSDNKTINGLVFESDSSKGIIFYLHGNAGALDTWGNVAKTYTDLNYDVFILDYRGFGKSEGSISSQNQLFDDVQLAYEKVTSSYKDKNIIVLGYSIGTCPATKIAADNNPKLLILQAPYYNFTSVIHGICPVVPSFLIKYKLETYKYVQSCKTPIVIFHGNKDDVIPVDNSLKLSELLKKEDELIVLDGIGHNDISDSGQYLEALNRILDKW